MEKKKYMKIPIFKEIILGNFSQVEQILSDEKELVNYKAKKSNDTCLILAARYKQPNIVKLLIESGANIEEQNVDGKRALHESAAIGCLQSSKHLLMANAQVDALKRADWTPSMFACVKGHLEILKLLVSYGANIRLTNKDGWNCFMLACREGYNDILSYLIGINPDIYKIKSNNGRTPIHTCAMHGQISTIKYIIKHCKTNIDDEDSCGVTPLMDALRFGHINIADVLIMNNANLHHSEKYGNMAIHLACQSGSLKSVDFLINQHSINVNLPSNNRKYLPIHYAAMEGHEELLKYLLSKNSSLNECNIDGRTPLHLAVAAHKKNIIKYLLSLGEIDKNLLDKTNRKPEDYAISSEVKSLFTDIEERCFDKVLGFPDYNKTNRRRCFKLLLQQLILKERVITTVNKGKALARLVEYVIDEAKKGNEPQVYYMMQSKEYVPRVFEDLLPRYEDLPSGYTNVYRLHSDAVYVQFRGRRLHRFNGNSVVELKYNSLPPLLPSEEELIKYTCDYLETKKEKAKVLEHGTLL